MGDVFHRWKTPSQFDSLDTLTSFLTSFLSVSLSTSCPGRFLHYLQASLICVDIISFLQFLCFHDMGFASLSYYFPLHRVIYIRDLHCLDNFRYCWGYCPSTHEVSNPKMQYGLVDRTLHA